MSAKKNKPAPTPTPAHSTTATTAKPETPKAAAPTAQPQPQPANKQQTTIGLLIEGWTKRRKESTSANIEVKDDGKYKLIVPGAGWPTIRIGSSGGIEMPEIKSYPRAFDAAINGKELLEKQTARATKKTAAPPPPPLARAAKPEPKKPETPTVKKQKEHRTLETQLA